MLAGAGSAWQSDRSRSSPGDVDMHSARLRHWLNSLKASLTYDRGQLDTLQEDVERLGRQMSAVRAQHANQHAHYGSAASSLDPTQQFLLGLVNDLDRVHSPFPMPDASLDMIADAIITSCKP